MRFLSRGKRKISQYVALSLGLVMIGCSPQVEAEKSEAPEAVAVFDLAQTVRGAAYVRAVDGGIEMLRFTPDLLKGEPPHKVGYNSVKARTTAGVSLNFLTDSPVVNIDFRYEKPFPVVVKSGGRSLTQRVTPEPPPDYPHRG